MAESEAALGLAGRASVLIVDDEPAVRNLVLLVLGRQGYDVIPAVDGEEAVRIVEQREGRFDLVFLDLSMPKMSGHDTFRKIRELDPTVPVIVSTGHQIDPEGFAEEAGSPAQGFVQKPFQVNQLTAAVRQVLDAGRPQ